ncbi:MAG: PTS glucose transporter subunit IIA [Lachnospiraceae bacterium]|nr:PTS glucose transporter subunit IIA [Lachnospiraceae bacterium]
MKKCKEEQILSFQCPVRGRVALLAETPDTTFSQEKIGCGVVVFPTGDTIYAPTNGRVIMFFPTEHAIAIECANGIEYFIHVGIGTAAMNGEGFRCYVKASGAM